MIAINAAIPYCNLFLFKITKSEMLVKTGLLVVSNPKHIGRILCNVQQNVKSTLYIQLLSALSEPLSFHPNLFTTWPKYSQTIWGIYSQVILLT